MNHIFPIAAALFAAACLAVRAQDSASSKQSADPSVIADEFVKSEMTKRHMPGLALAVIREGKPVKVEGYGLANVELNVPAKPDTIFQIQSMTKQFTATGIMMLVEEGKVGLDDKISKYLDGTPDTWKEVTVRRLLTHTSGIKDFINEPVASLRLDVTEEEVLKQTAPRPLNFPVGDKYSYCNTGYHLLGMIIHKVSGKTWGEFVEERICKPLGMNDTHVYSQQTVIPNRASGYRYSDGKLFNGQFVAPSILAYAGGGLTSTVVDLCKWDAALYTEKILKRSSLDQMWTSGLLNDGRKAGYGFGWAVGVSHDHRFQEHSGAHVTGFTSHILRYPDDKITIVVLTNLAGANPAAIARGVANIYVPGIFSPRGLAAKPDPDAARQARITQFMEDVAKGVTTSANYAPGLNAALDDDDRSEMSTLLKAKRSFDFLESLDVHDLNIERNGSPIQTTCFYRLITESQENWHYRFWLTSEGLVADYSDRE